MIPPSLMGASDAKAVAASSLSSAVFSSAAEILRRNEAAVRRATIAYAIYMLMGESLSYSWPSTSRRISGFWWESRSSCSPRSSIWLRGALRPGVHIDEQCSARDRDRKPSDMEVLWSSVCPQLVNMRREDADDVRHDGNLRRNGGIRHRDSMGHMALPELDPRTRRGGFGGRWTAFHADSTWLRPQPVLVLAGRAPHGGGISFLVI